MVKEQPKIYLTSDLHLGHKAMIEQKFRPFKTLNEMNLLIIRNYNNTVADDKCYVLGDVAFGKYKKDYTLNLNNAMFVKGNHDPNSLTNIQSMIIKFKGKTFELVHNSVDATLCADYVIHGHIHKTGDRRFAENIKQYNDYIWYDEHGNIFYNVNIEFHRYKPVLINNILGELQKVEKELELDKLSL